LNAAVWVFRLPAIGTTSECRQRSLTGGPVFGVHYTLLPRHRPVNRYARY